MPFFMLLLSVLMQRYGCMGGGRGCCLEPCFSASADLSCVDFNSQISPVCANTIQTLKAGCNLFVLVMVQFLVQLSNFYYSNTCTSCLMTGGLPADFRSCLPRDLIRSPLSYLSCRCLLKRQEEGSRKAWGEKKNEGIAKWEREDMERGGEGCFGLCFQHRGLEQSFRAKPQGAFLTSNLPLSPTAVGCPLPMKSPNMQLPLNLTKPLLTQRISYKQILQPTQSTGWSQQWGCLVFAFRIS